MINEIEMPFWQNPQCHVFTQHYRDKLVAYFTCWDENADLIEGELGEINFTNVAYFRIEKKVKIYFPDEPQYRSSIYEVMDSTESAEYLNKRKNWDSSNFELNKYRLFVVNSHDYQLVVLSEDYSFDIKKLNNFTHIIYQQVLELI